jgi:hypothetical protein
MTHLKTFVMHLCEDRTIALGNILIAWPSAKLFSFSWFGAMLILCLLVPKGHGSVNEWLAIILLWSSRHPSRASLAYHTNPYSVDSVQWAVQTPTNVWPTALNCTAPICHNSHCIWMVINTNCMTKICDTNPESLGSQLEFNISWPLGTIRPKINIVLNHEN